MVLYPKSVIRVYFGSEDKYRGALKQKTLKTAFFKKLFYHQGFFAVKRRAVFILGAMW